MYPERRKASYSDGYLCFRGSGDILADLIADGGSGPQCPDRFLKTPAVPNNFRTTKTESADYKTGT